MVGHGGWRRSRSRDPGVSHRRRSFPWPVGRPEARSLAGQGKVGSGDGFGVTSETPDHQTQKHVQEGEAVQVSHTHVFVFGCECCCRWVGRTRKGYRFAHLRRSSFSVYFAQIIIFRGSPSNLYLLIILGGVK